MPKYYHIHRGTEPSTLEKKFIKNIPLFFSKKNSNWYNMEIEISTNYFDGYRIYEISIPSNKYTFSFNSTSVDKIVKITPYNINNYILLLHSFNSRNNFIKEMKKRNIIGIDCTIEHKDAFIYGPPEGYIWKKPSDIKIKLISIIKL